MVRVRPATESDEALLLEWANDPTTRAAGFHPEPIDPATHHDWLTARLHSSSGRLFVGTVEGRPVGQVRLDQAPDGSVEVGISVARESRGRGLGRALLLAGLEAAAADEDLAPARFLARVRQDNAVSMALFEGAGFRLVGSGRCDGVPCVHFERAAGAPPGDGAGRDLSG